MYAERLTVPLRWWVQGTMLVASFWIAAVVAFPVHLAWVPSAIAVLVLALVALGLATYGGARVAVTEHGTLVAGRAEVGLEHVGDVVTLDAEQTRLVAGRHADARAYLVLRPYLRRSVKVTITDPADPTPYWLVSCRRPERLAAAVASARQLG
ncbi:DUF3093 domain-containing protein [Nocardioides sp. ChNu-153]|uniref:DUF3093 domain-containing protein n=1 Tax=unclassified Nocardioides TaxID=2615069 RepID=UPI002405F580|nr:MULTISPECIES: DUF3093 domain-containing protein [unclassified Nocardioides]MDF9717675.1 DUF3093 domain-containing protein [Nocardioides sp. ChNu-99]MDN7121219.1 DUF3093 domain-containing protein [Nocardioides sp. ChNu-153]